MYIYMYICVCVCIQHFLSCIKYRQCDIYIYLCVGVVFIFVDIYFFDALSGRELSDPLRHKLEVDQLDLSRSGTQRLLAFTDKNHDLFVVQVRERTAETTPTPIG